jgi:hypothetical protein
MKRKKISDSRSRRLFTKGAININRKNVSPRPMRGGIRL